MIDFILLAITLSLVINGVHIVMTWQDMLLQDIGLQLEGYLPELIHKPLFSCATCMSSIWGFTTYIIYFNNPDIISLLAFIFSVACLATLINLLLEFLNK